MTVSLGFLFVSASPALPSAQKSLTVQEKLTNSPHEHLACRMNQAISGPTIFCKQNEDKKLYRGRATDGT
jgi:hypothetical protein